MNTYLKSLPTGFAPTFLACVMWQDDEHNVHRYQLWSDIGETVPLGYPLYAGQLIKKNFRFEVWCIDSSVVTQATAFNLLTSVLQGADYRFASDAALVNSDGLVTDFSAHTVVVDVVPDVGVVPAGWWKATTINGINWYSSEGNNMLMKNSTGTAFTTFTAPIATPLTAVNSPYMFGTGYGGAFVSVTAAHTFIVCNILGVTAGTICQLFGGATPMDVFFNGVDDTTVNVFLEDGSNLNVPANTWIVLEIAYEAGQSAIHYYNILGAPMTATAYPSGFVASTTTPSPNTVVNFGDVAGDSSYLAEYITFPVYVGAGNIQLMLNYFWNKYNFVFALPLTFPSNATSVTNS